MSFMGRSRSLPCRAITLAAILAFLETSALLHAQLGPLVSPFQAPQAKTQEELDIYLQIVTESDPSKTVREVEEFAARYPKSDLLGTAYQYEMFAYQQLNDFGGLLGAGQKALKLQPKNVNTLLTLALSIPESVGQRPDSSELLGLAEGYAHQALEELPKMHIPRRISMEQWNVMQAEMGSRAHEALGSCMMRRGKPEDAIAELKAAILASPKPEGHQFYKLGLAYAKDGKMVDAREAWRRAAKLGPEAVRELVFKEPGMLPHKDDDEH